MPPFEICLHGFDAVDVHNQFEAFNFILRLGFEEQTTQNRTFFTAGNDHDIEFMKS